MKSTTPTLREIELFHSANLVPTLQLKHVPHFLSLVLDAPATKVSVSLKYEYTETMLELWVVRGTKAVLWTGPTELLPDGRAWLCNDEEALCYMILEALDEKWGNDVPDEFLLALNQMAESIPYGIGESPSSSTGSKSSGFTDGPKRGGLT